MGRSLTKVLVVQNQKFRSSLFKGLQGFGTESRIALRRERNLLDKTIFEGYKGNFFTKKVSLNCML